MSEIKNEAPAQRENAGKEIVSNAKLLEAGAYFGHKKAK